MKYSIALFTTLLALSLADKPSPTYNAKATAKKVPVASEKDDLSAPKAPAVDVAQARQDSYGAPQNSYSAPQNSYSAPAQNSYGAPQAPAQNSYGAPQAPVQDTYGSPQAPVSDTYGSPQASPVNDQYGSPQAPVQNAAPAPQQAPVSTQGYYYYYYPVQNGGGHGGNNGGHASGPSYGAPSYNAPSYHGGASLKQGGGFLDILAGKGLLTALLVGGLVILGVAGASVTFGRNFNDGLLRTVSDYIPSSKEDVDEIVAMLSSAYDWYEQIYGAE